MLDIQPPDFKFCPFCGRKLKIKIEEEKKRKFCSFCNWTYYPHVAVSAAAIIVRKNKVLMVKRAREPYKNTWMFPAGFIDFGEHPLETLKREVWEETGLKVKKAKLEENKDIAWIEIKNPPKIGWKSHRLVIKNLQKSSSANED